MIAYAARLNNLSAGCCLVTSSVTAWTAYRSYDAWVSIRSFVKLPHFLALSILENAAPRIMKHGSLP